MRIKYFYLVSSFALTIVLLLIGSPGFSLSKAMFGIFLPNEKIVFMFLTFFLIRYKEKINKQFKILITYSLYVFTIYLIYFLLREFFFEIPITTPNVNHFLGLISTILLGSYLSLFSKEKITRGLLYSLIFQLIISGLQLYFILSGNYLIFTKFNNHYSQCFACANTFAAQTLYGLPRIQGLFNEASGLSAFSGVTLIYSLSSLKFFKSSKLIPNYFLRDKYLSFDKQNLTNFLLIIFSLIGLLISLSTTGILIVAIFLFIMSVEKFIQDGGKTNLYLILLFLIGLFISSRLQVFELLYNTFFGSERLKQTISKFNYTLGESDSVFFLGTKASWTNATWDSITRYIQVFGLFGSIPQWIIIFYLIFQRNFLFSVSVFPLFLSNSPLSMGHSILILGLIININFSKIKTKIFSDNKI